MVFVQRGHRERTGLWQLVAASPEAPGPTLSGHYFCPPGTFSSWAGKKCVSTQLLPFPSHSSSSQYLHPGQQRLTLLNSKEELGNLQARPRPQTPRWWPLLTMQALFRSLKKKKKKKTGKKSFIKNIKSVFLKRQKSVHTLTHARNSL